MARKYDSIEEKLEYIGLDLEKTKEKYNVYEPIEYIISKEYDEMQYKQYRYIPVNEIQILLSPTNRLDSLEKKYKAASPLYEYLDNEDEENYLKHTTFLEMLKQVKIEEIKKVEEEQENLNKKIPFKIKYEGNYLWQIYYSEQTGKYFTIVPTADSEYSTFFYLLKKQIEGKKEDKIFVPIRNIEYTNKFLKKKQFEDIANYMWLFTKDWPFIYEVYDNNGSYTIQIIGETFVYENIRSPYKIKLRSKDEAINFYKLIKALFIIQTEVPNYYQFKTKINKNGGIGFFEGEEEITYNNISEFVSNEYKKAVVNIKKAKKYIEKYQDKLDNKKIEALTLEKEYLEKEKQISTFLECKKSFFGKVKYYFKYSKKKEKNTEKNEEIKELKKDINLDDNQFERTRKSNFTIEDLVEIYKEFGKLENEMKNILMDINAINLKTKNLKKKIENATIYIDQIEQHKKSIFEFWKYSNKDNVSALPEGEKEEAETIKEIKRKFDFTEDIDRFGENLDRIQRKVLTKQEADSIYISTTSQIDVINEINSNTITDEKLDAELKLLKRERIKDKSLKKEEYDVFGGLVEDNTKLRTLSNKKHRELPKDKYRILDIDEKTTIQEYKKSLQKVTENINKAMEKIKLQEDIVIYKALSSGKITDNILSVFDMNLEKELIDNTRENNKVIIYRLNIGKDTNVLGYTNSIYYDNTNRTLPVGMNSDSRVLMDISKVKLKLDNKTTFRIIEFEDEKNDFSKAKIKAIMVKEYKQKEK